MPQAKLRSIKKSPMPKWIAPMLATLGDKPFDDEEWLFETKWDGCRALALNELKSWSGQLIVDGEIVVLDKNGASHCQIILVRTI